jgi:PAS domain S-box-containing protein
MPHGHCYFWRPEIVWLMVISNALIALAYFTIPFTIFYFLSRRSDLVFNWVFALFGFFIIFCGLTHVFDIITIWYPVYRTDVVIRMLTAGVSLGTGIYLIKLMPVALAIPSRQQMETVNQELDVINRELRSTEKNLKELTDDLLDAQRIAHIGSWKYNIHSRELEWSEETCRIFGLEPGTIRRYDQITDFIYPDDREKQRMIMETAIATGTEYNCTYRIIDKSGSLRYLYSRGRQIYNDAGEAVYLKGTTQDVTDLRKHEEALEKSNQKLQMANRELERSNRELEQFAYVASHDLQEPLRTISSYLQLLEMKYKSQLDSQAHEFIDYAIDGSRRMRDLIKDLLDLSRLNMSAEVEVLNVQSVVDLVLDSLKESVRESNATITVGDMPLIVASRLQMMQLFNNLISNSLKFRRADSLTVRIGAEDKGSHWQFSVSDNGIGIDKAYAEKIFVVFQRLHTREKYPGTGIGLAICKKIAELHGGSIWFESEPGKGTTFYFTISKNR